MLVLITRFKKNNQPAACLRKGGRNFLPSEHEEERHSSGPLCPLSPVVRLCTHLLAACLSVGVEANTGPPGEDGTCASPGVSW